MKKLDRETFGKFIKDFCRSKITEQRLDDSMWQLAEPYLEPEPLGEIKNSIDFLKWLEFRLEEEVNIRRYHNNNEELRRVDGAESDNYWRGKIQATYDILIAFKGLIWKSDLREPTKSPADVLDEAIEKIAAEVSHLKFKKLKEQFTNISDIKLETLNDVLIILENLKKENQ